MNDLHSFYNLDIKIVLDNLRTDENGLSSKEVSRRQKENGKNVLEEKNHRNLILTLFSQFLSPLIFILIFASAVTIYLKEYLEAVVIWISILINVFFSTYQEYKAENAIEQLKKITKNKALVKRSGQTLQVDAEELVAGDIVLLQYGSRVPADIRVMEANDLRVDESILTGESMPVQKENIVVTEQLVTERHNYCFCGTLVVNGNGIGVVTHIGEATEIGKIAKNLADTKKVLTPVQTAVKNISWYVFLIALVIVLFVFALGVWRGENIFEMMVLASAVAVGAVPEALPIALTVILSIGVLEISKKGGLIRKLAAAETLGSTTLILTDKTGTLTEGNLRLENILDLTQEKAGFDQNNLNDRQWEALSLARNNFATFSGNAFENILEKLYQEKNNQVNLISAKIIHPFNSSNKYSVSLVDKKYVVLGAPDILINNSSFSLSEKEEFIKRIYSLSEEGKRLIAVAIREGEGDFVLGDLKIKGLFVFSDVLRKGIAKDISRIIQSGIMVKMITGDLPGTAKFIGGQIGISANNDEILTGAQLTNLDDNDLLKILPKIKIFARVTPEDKLRVGRLYQELGEIVAMTGDGVNDSPSLKAMDIGISLSSGSEVAKSAADMILLKDSFSTIVNTILVGHNIKRNIQKVFTYLMSNSLDEVFVVTGSLIFALALPLTALQIIWVNILTGTLPALAFAYDKTYRFGKMSKSIFDFRVKFLALGVGALSSLFLFLLYYVLVQSISDIKIAQSIFFMCFASYVLIISYSFVDLERQIWQYNPFGNWRLNIANVVGLVLVFTTVYTQLGQRIFSVVHVPFSYLWILAIWLLLNIWVIELAKMLVKLIHLFAKMYKKM